MLLQCEGRKVKVRRSHRRPFYSPRGCVVKMASGGQQNVSLLLGQGHSTSSGSSVVVASVISPPSL